MRRLRGQKYKRLRSDRRILVAPGHTSPAAERASPMEMKRKHESPSPSLPDIGVAAADCTSPPSDKIQLAAHHVASSNAKTRKRTPSLITDPLPHDMSGWDGPDRKSFLDEAGQVSPPTASSRTLSLLLDDVPTNHPQSPNSIEPSPKMIPSSREALSSPREPLPPRDIEDEPSVTTTSFPPKRARNRNPGNLLLDLSQMTPMTSPTKSTDCTNVCSQVTDFLFVGGASVAAQRELLERNGITHVINCAATVTPNYFPHVFDYYRLRLRDHATQDIHQHFYSIFQFIDAARARHGKVFIHCVKGISRSPAMAIAYLMAREQLGLYPALELVRSSRPVIDPNAGFIFQLNEWDSLRQQHSKQPITLFRVDMTRGDVDGVPDVPLPDYPLIIGPVQADHLMASSPLRNPLQDPPQIHDQHAAACFVVCSMETKYCSLWCGRDATDDMIATGKTAMRLLQTYEAFPDTFDVVRSGQEPSAFWSVLAPEQDPNTM